MGATPLASDAERRRGLWLVTVLLLIEFLDELVDGVMGAAWPAIRAEFQLGYDEVGLAMSLPVLFCLLLEPALALWADMGKRRTLVASGGVSFSASLILCAAAWCQAVFVASRMLFFPASGAFVNLAQAALMELEPQRRAVMMARWTLAGSLGVVVGPLLLAGCSALGWGWRAPFVLMGGLSLAAAAWFWKLTDPNAAPPPEVEDEEEGSGEEKDEGSEAPSFGAQLWSIVEALRSREVWKWLALLAASNLLLDILTSLLSLYLVDVRGWSQERAALASSVRAGVGFAGDALFVVVAARVDGLRWVRWTALASVVFYPIFLLWDHGWVSLGLLGVLGFCGAGWYAVLKAKLYDALPHRPGLVVAVGAAFEILEGGVPLGLGVLAEQTSLTASMWVLLLGPALLWIFSRPSAAGTHRSGGAPG
jgi:FSR family fosmidomycin resistance protein-like MFS transporter